MVGTGGTIKSLCPHPDCATSLVPVSPPRTRLSRRLQSVPAKHGDLTVKPRTRRGRYPSISWWAQAVRLKTCAHILVVPVSPPCTRPSRRLQSVPTGKRRTPFYRDEILRGGELRSPAHVSFCKGSPLHHHTSPTNGGVRNGSGYCPPNSPDNLLKYGAIY